MIDVSDVPTKTPDEAWEDLVKADQARDMDDIRDVESLHSSFLRYADNLSGPQSLCQGCSRHRLAAARAVFPH